MCARGDSTVGAGSHRCTVTYLAVARPPRLGEELVRAAALVWGATRGRPGAKASADDTAAIRQSVRSMMLVDGAADRPYGF